MLGSILNRVPNWVITCVPTLASRVCGTIRNSRHLLVKVTSSPKRRVLVSTRQSFDQYRER